MSDLFDNLDPLIAETLRKRGFSALTPVQERVLLDAAGGADLRISSQTGSGKTVAVGLVMANDWAAQTAAGTAPNQTGDRKSPAAPWATLVAPTRELATQVHKELSWLLEPLGIKLLSCTGGTNVSLDRRALAGFRGILVGTPGRICDHLRSERLDLSALNTLVLDEADQMLDLGFRDELDAIVQGTPKDRRTHFVSATFRDEVGRLADRYQRNAKQVQGTPLGAANSDIEHVVHVIRERDMEAAVVNLLLCAGNKRTLVFARTRADVATIVERLTQRGFAAAAISGDLAQAQRERALAAFQRGTVPILVATDVASRGIHVEDIDLVIQAEAPRDPEVYIHRSGRTGRAGNKGRSVLLVPDRAVGRAQRMFQDARIKPTVLPIPTLADVTKAQDERVLAALANPAPAAERFSALAKQLCEATDPEQLVAALLADNKTFGGPCGGMHIEPVAQRGSRRDQGEAPRAARGHTAPGQFVSFFVNWGQQHGATAGRVLSMACRRGGIQSEAIGAIRVGDKSTIVEVHADLADTFAHKTAQPDARDPKIKIRLFDEQKPQPVGVTATSAPPRKFDNSAPPRKFDNSAPPRKFDDSAPPRKFDNSAPPRKFDEAASAPPLRRSDELPPRREFNAVSTATAPRKFDSSALPRKFNGSAPPRKFEDAETAAPPRKFHGSAPPRKFEDAGTAAPPRKFDAAETAAPPRKFHGSAPPRKFEDAASARKFDEASKTKPRKFGAHKSKPRTFEAPAVSQLSPAAKARKKQRKAEKRAAREQQASA